MKRVWLVLIAMTLLVAGVLVAQGPPAMPLTEKELIDILKSKQQRPQAVTIVQQRGVAFEMNPDIEKQLRKAKADDTFIEVVKKQGPSERAARAAVLGGATITPEEGREMQAIQGELDPDRMVQMAKDFEQKHPSSALLTYIYVFVGTAYQQKGDLKQTVEYCEKSLKLKNDNLMALLVVAPLLPQPQLLQGVDPDKRLAEAENDAKTAMKLIEELKPQANETPEQFAGRKNTYLRDMNSALGMVHLQRSLQSLVGPDKDELSKAEEAYQTATTISAEAQPADYYRLGETRERLKKYPEAIEAYTKAGELGAGTAIKTYADQRIEAIKKGLGQTKYSAGEAPGADEPRHDPAKKSVGRRRGKPRSEDDWPRKSRGLARRALRHLNRLRIGMTGVTLEELQSLIGYQFQNPQLLREALTHSSYAQETSGPAQDNEKLEFLGDAVLNFVVSVRLADVFPDYEEGKLSRARARLVAAEHLARAAANLRLGDYLRLGRGEEKTGGRAKMNLQVDALEALVAALYRDGGLDAARNFIERFILPPDLAACAEELFAIDFKSALQEFLQAAGTGPANYRVAGESGPEHQKVFTVEVDAGDNGIARGRGGSKKAAEQQAARNLLESLGRKP